MKRFRFAGSPRAPPVLNFYTQQKFKNLEERKVKTTYLVWVNPPRDGVNPDWKEITGKEFFALTRSPEAAVRYFIKLESTDEDGDDGRIVMESTKAEYREWRKEKDHSDYIRKNGDEKGYQTFSYHDYTTSDGDFYGEEILWDYACDVEKECLNVFAQEAVWAAVARLNEKDQRMIRYLYLSDKPGTERGYSALTGIPYMTVHDRKTRILKRLKNFLKK